MNSESRIQDSESNGLSQFPRNGFQIVKAVANSSECKQLSAELMPLFEQQQKSTRARIGGVRNLLRTNPRVSQFAKSEKLIMLLEDFSGASMFPVRAIFFDKNPDANWLVPWHQDLAVAVSEQIETPGFTGWSIKDEVLHVHPPRAILESMITLRLHLDDCAANNGALKVISDSHRDGKLGVAEISKRTATGDVVVCEAARGDALLMRPLLLHASAPAESPAHRRVLHIEYASTELPNGLKWFDS